MEQRKIKIAMIDSTGNVINKPSLYDQGRLDERERIINLIENCIWKDADMLIDLIRGNDHENKI